MKASLFRSRISSLLFWSIVSAAFIGPGTITTASKAGASYGFTLIWALIFSVIACIIIQEAAARIAILSNHNLGQSIANQWGRNSIMVYFVFTSILIGGIAYQAGNVLGAVAGFSLLFSIHPAFPAIMFSTFATGLLWFGNYRIVAKTLGIAVAIMGIAFIYISVQLDIQWSTLFKGAFIPSIPPQSEWIIIALIGTTIVPYNIFLGSGISKGQPIKEMRFGISLAIIIGGIISMAILIAGTSIVDEFSYERLKSVMDNSIGSAGGLLLGIGLMAAGFTSAVTAPLAAAVTAKSLFKSDLDSDWSEKGWKYKLVWIIVIFAGVVFSTSGIKPIPAIIVAQAINGLLLPIAVIFLLFSINNSQVLPKNQLNSKLSNVVFFVIVYLAVFLGLINIFKALSVVFGFNAESISILWPSLIAIGILIPLLFKISKLRAMVNN